MWWNSSSKKKKAAFNSEVFANKRPCWSTLNVITVTHSFNGFFFISEMAFFQAKSYKASYNKQGLLLFSTHNMKNILERSELQPICCSLARRAAQLPDHYARLSVKQTTCFLRGVPPRASPAPLRAGNPSKPLTGDDNLGIPFCCICSCAICCSLKCSVDFRLLFHPAQKKAGCARDK